MMRYVVHYQNQFPSDRMTAQNAHQKDNTMKTIIAAALVALTAGTASAKTTVCDNLGGDRFVFTDDAADRAMPKSW
jgi:hypothetical protein